MTPTDANPPSPDQPSGAVPPHVGDSYEFTGRENAVIGRLGEKMHFVGLFTLGVGVLAIGFGVMRRDLGPVVSGLLYAMMGVWTERAGAQFRTVVVTEGHDIRHLMHALEDLRRLYTLQFWICLIAIVAALVLLGASYLY
jgi:hypothetical protein